MDSIHEQERTMMQQMPATNGQITRAEYEARNSALLAQIAQNEARLMGEITSVRTDMDRKFDRLLESVENLRRDLVAERALEPRLSALQNQITRGAQDIKDVKEMVENLDKKQMGRAELSAIRAGAIAGFGGIIVYLLQLITHFKP